MVNLLTFFRQIDSLVNYFDWALNEQCYQFKECDTLQPFIEKVKLFLTHYFKEDFNSYKIQNKAVFGAEYKGDASKICPDLNSLQLSFIRTDIDVHGGNIIPCCQYLDPPCPIKSYNCVSRPSSYPVYPDDSGASSLFVSFFFVLATVVLIL